MSEPTLLILEPGGERRRGRPRDEPSGEPKSAILAWVPNRDHDAIVRLANADGVSVSKYVGGILSRVAQMAPKTNYPNK